MSQLARTKEPYTTERYTISGAAVVLRYNADLVEVSVPKTFADLPTAAREVIQRNMVGAFTGPDGIERLRQSLAEAEKETT